MASTRGSETTRAFRPTPFFDHGLFLLHLKRGKVEMVRECYETASFLELSPRRLVAPAHHLFLAAVQVQKKEPVIEERGGSEGPRRLGSPRRRHPASVSLSGRAREPAPAAP